MKRLLCVLPFFLISCEKEVISPNKYLAALNSGKSAVVVKSDKKPFKLRLRKRKRKYEKINKSSVSPRNRISKHSIGCYTGIVDTTIRNSRPNTNPND
jgi:hypothetical protein